MIKCTIGAVVYKGAWQYLKDFFESIAKQNGDREFDLLILNDDCDVIKLNNLVSNIITDKVYKILNYDGRDYEMTPALFRMELLKQAKKEDVELLVVGDCDDMFTPDRIDSILKSVDTSKGFSFYYNDLVLENGDKVFKNLPNVVSKENVICELSQGNFLGMGTCAYDMRQISEDYIESLCDADVTAYDWYLCTRLLMDIAPGKFVPDASMVYRLYDENAAGVVTEYNQKNLTRELAFKRQHYALLGKRYVDYKSLSDKFEELYSEGKDDLTFWKKYRGKNNKGLWWNLVEI